MALLDPQLGTRMHSFGVVLHGTLTEQRWPIFLKAVAKAIGMEAVAEAAVWNYPVDGKGGVGQTIMLPITESFIVLDTWRDHRGAYLFVCSCRPFSDVDIDLVAASFGLRAGIQNARFTAELNLI